LGVVARGCPDNFRTCPVMSGHVHLNLVPLRPLSDVRELTENRTCPDMVNLWSSCPLLAILSTPDVHDVHGATSLAA